MEIYSSSFNSTQNTTKEQQGTIAFKIPPNKSGKAIIKFQIPFQNKPFVSLNVEVNVPEEHQIRYTMGNITLNDFVVCILNNDHFNEMGGNINWMAK